MSGSFVSLMYHNLVPTGRGGGCAALSPSIRSYFLDERVFAAQLQVLARSTRVLSCDDVRRFYASPDASAASLPSVHLTFDDGWKDCVELGGPLLAEHGWQANLFVTTDLIGKPQFVTTADLQRIDVRTFHVGSHSHTHCFLNELPDDRIRNELQSSKLRLEDILGRPVDTLSIPNGAIDNRVRRIALEVGYGLIFTSSTHRNTRRSGPDNIGRVAIRSTTTADDVAAFAQGRFLHERCRQRLLSLPKQLLGAAGYRTLRRTLLGERPGEQDMAELAVAGDPAER